MTKIPFFDCTPSEAQQSELIQVASEVISSGTYIGGHHVTSFERELASYLGANYAVSVGNGLDALTLSLRAIGIGPGDEVIVPSFTFIASWISVMTVGAVAVAVDVDPTSGLIDIEQIRRKLTPKTKAILPVNLFGSPVDITKIFEELGTEIAVIEDCAQSIGAYSGDYASGTMATAGAFSFYPTKNLGALGDGGAVVTNDEGLAKRLTSLRSYGFSESRYSFGGPGYNSRLDSLQAAFLSVKLKALDQEIKFRRWQAGEYDLAMQNPLIKALIDSGTESVYHHYPLVTQNRDAFRSYMSESGIETDMHYPYTIEILATIHPQEAFRFGANDLLGANELASKIVTLPIGSWLGRGGTLTVAKALADFPLAD